MKKRRPKKLEPKEINKLKEITVTVCQTLQIPPQYINLALTYLNMLPQQTLINVYKQIEQIVKK